jgi:hypothetical protein
MLEGWIAPRIKVESGTELLARSMDLCSDCAEKILRARQLLQSISASWPEPPAAAPSEEGDPCPVQREMPASEF